jgi:hypothetical protein
LRAFLRRSDAGIAVPKNEFLQINAYSETRKCAGIGNPAWQEELLPRKFVYLEEAMKTLALGLAAALGLALPAIADTTARNVQLAQATQDSGAQSGGGTAGTQKSGGGTAGTQKSGGGAAATQRSGDNAQSSGTAGATRQVEGRREGSRTNIRANVRIGGDGDRVRSRTTTTHRFGVRSRVGSSDDVVIRRKNARRYVYSEPSSVTIKKKKKARRYVYSEPSSVIVKRKKVRRYVYDEPSSTTVIRNRRPGVNVGVGVSTRTSVRERAGASVNVRGSATTRSSTTTRSTTGGSTSGGTNAQSTTQQSGTSGGMQTRGTSGSGGQTRGTSGTGGGETSGTKQ